MFAILPKSTGTIGTIGTTMNSVGGGAGGGSGGGGWNAVSGGSNDPGISIQPNDTNDGVNTYININYKKHSNMT